jgi:hypothetical protein
VYVAFGRGVVLDHAPRWWERIWLRFSLLLRPGLAPRSLGDRIELAGPHGPDIDGTAGAAERVPRRPPDKPLAGAVALLEPSSADELELLPVRARTTPRARDSFIAVPR